MQILYKTLQIMLHDEPPLRTLVLPQPSEGGSFIDKSSVVIIESQYNTPLNVCRQIEMTTFTSRTAIVSCDSGLVVEILYKIRPLLQIKLHDGPIPTTLVLAAVI